MESGGGEGGGGGLVLVACRVSVKERFFLFWV
jgi:hypothetical protein